MWLVFYIPLSKFLFGMFELSSESKTLNGDQAYPHYLKYMYNHKKP